MNGYVEFSFHMDQEVVKVMSSKIVNDGLRHTVIVNKNKNRAMLKLDDLSPVYKEGSGSLFSFNTLGNIYIGKNRMRSFKKSLYL